MNIYDYLTPQSGETFTTLLEHKNIKINRIVSSDDLEETEYIQEEDEWLVVLEGQATLLLNDEKKTLIKRRYTFHSFKNTPSYFKYTKRYCLANGSYLLNTLHLSYCVLLCYVLFSIPYLYIPNPTSSNLPQ